MLIERLRPPSSIRYNKKIKLEAKYFIIISAEFIDRRELLQISFHFFILDEAKPEKEINKKIFLLGLTYWRS